MSHFAVLVIGDNVEEQLSPYHEFECTGVDDEYVKDVDITEERREEFNTGTTTKLVDLDGDFADPYDNPFYRDPTPEEEELIGPLGSSDKSIACTTRDWNDGKGYRAKVHFIPEGWRKEEVPFTKLMSFIEFNSSKWHGSKVLNVNEEPTEDHTYGYTLVDEDKVIKVINRTNPNAKWDWYSVGGRWTGWLKLKEGTKGQLGKKSWASDEPEEGTADILRKGDIDFEAMMKDAEEKATRKYNEVVDVTKGERWSTWEEVRAQHSDINEARDIYNSQPAVVRIHESDNLRFLANQDSFLLSLEEYVAQARNREIVPYAIVKEGQWIAKGDMGWWGISRNEGDEEEWCKKATELLMSLPDDTLITVVDCHI